MLIHFRPRLVLATLLIHVGCFASTTTIDPSVPAAPAATRFGTLRRIAISDSLEKAERLAKAPPGPDPVASDLPVFQRREILDVVRPFIGQVADHAHLRALGEALTAFLRQHDFPVSAINFPDPTEEARHAGTTRCLVTIGRYAAIDSRGHRYSSRPGLMRQMGIQPGEKVRFSVLHAAVSSISATPFRSVDAVIHDQGGGEAALELSLTEQRPYQFSADYDNQGTVYTGRNRYTAIAELGNMWGLEHQFRYQFTQARQARQYQVHAVEYRLPLQRRSWWVGSAGWARVRPEFAGTSFTATGRNASLVARHVVHHAWGEWVGEYTTGINFKAVQNDLEFGGAPYLVDGHPFQSFHVLQLFAGETLRRDDARGFWWIAATLHLSPGGFDARNTDAAFSRTRSEARARYAYGTGVLQRVTVLPFDFQLCTRLHGQMSSGPLLASEQLWLGGATTLRGYDERAYPGDNAIVGSQEVRGPVWSYRTPFKSYSRGELRVHVFVDAGRVHLHRPTTDDLHQPTLLSAGAGLRMNFGGACNVSFDYGRPLRKTAGSLDAPGGRGHLQVRVVF